MPKSAANSASCDTFLIVNYTGV